MTGTRLKTPALLLLLLLLLLGALTGTGNNNTTNVLRTNTTRLAVPGGSGSGEPGTSTYNFSMTEKSGFGNIDQPILIGAVVGGIIIGAIIIVGIVIWCRSSTKAGNPELTKEDPHLDGPSSEKVPMPMFEEDVPSVLELEMDELDQWMKKDS